MDFDLDWAFNSYSDSFLQDMLVIMTEFSNLGITVEDFVSYAKKEFAEARAENYQITAENEARRMEWESKKRRCVCGSKMSLETVNDSEGTMVGGLYKSMWFCPDVFGCGETLYSERAIHEEAEAHGLGEFYPDPKKRLTQREMRRRFGKRMRTKYTRPNNPRPPSQCGGCR